MPRAPRPAGPALASPPASGDEYDPVELAGGLHVLSLACFFAALGSRFVVDWIPPELRPLPKPALSVLAVPFFASLGLGVGLIGLRSGRGREVARLGVFLNGAALAVAVLFIAALLLFLRR